MFKGAGQAEHPVDQAQELQCVLAGVAILVEQPDDLALVGLTLGIARLTVCRQLRQGYDSEGIGAGQTLQGFPVIAPALKIVDSEAETYPVVIASRGVEPRPASGLINEPDLAPRRPFGFGRRP